MNLSKTIVVLLFFLHSLPIASLQEVNSIPNTLSKSAYQLSFNPAFQLDVLSFSSTIFNNQPNLSGHRVHITKIFGNYTYHIGENYFYSKYYKEMNSIFSLNRKFKKVVVGGGYQNIQTSAETEYNKFNFSVGLNQIVFFGIRDIQEPLFHIQLPLSLQKAWDCNIMILFEHMYYYKFNTRYSLTQSFTIYNSFLSYPQKLNMGLELKKSIFRLIYDIDIKRFTDYDHTFGIKIDL